MQTRLDIPISTIWGRFFCPNCGKEGLPEKVICFIECIAFYNCVNPECNFSTWDLEEYKAHEKKAKRETSKENSPFKIPSNVK